MESSSRSYMGAAQAQFRCGHYAEALSLAIKAAHNAPSAVLKSSLLLSARAALLCQHASKAMKYASRLVILDATDPSLRALVKECTLEMEYEARARELQAACVAACAARRSASQHGGDIPSPAYTPQHDAVHVYQRIQSLLDQLLEEDEQDDGPFSSLPQPTQPAHTQHDTKSILMQLLQVASQTVESQIAFSLASGYTAVMPFFPAHPIEVEQLLVAVGTCKLAQASNPPPAADAPNRTFTEVRLRWPQMVLQRLVGMAVDTATNTRVRTRCLAMLAYAAQDSIIRHTSFVRPPTWAIATNATTGHTATSESSYISDMPSAGNLNMTNRSIVSDVAGVANASEAADLDPAIALPPAPSKLWSPRNTLRAAVASIVEERENPEDESMAMSAMCSLPAFRGCVSANGAVCTLPTSASADVLTAENSVASSAGHSAVSSAQGKHRRHVSFSDQASIPDLVKPAAGSLQLLSTMVAASHNENSHNLPAPDSILTRLLEALTAGPCAAATGLSSSRKMTGTTPTALVSLPMQALCSAVYMMSCFTRDKHSVHMLVQGGRAWEAALAMYALLHPVTQSDGTMVARHSCSGDTGVQAQIDAGLWNDAALPSSTPICCAAAHVVVQSLSALIAHDHSSFQQEAFISKSSETSSFPSRSSSTSCIGSVVSSTSSAKQQSKLKPTSLIPGIASAIQYLASHCSTPCLQPDYGFDGELVGYMAGKKPADPCLHHVQAAHPNTDQSAATPPSSTSLLFRWLSLATSIAQTGRAASKELYRCGTTNILQQIVQQYLIDLQLVRAAEKLWAIIAFHCAQAWDEIVEETFVAPLVGAVTLYLPLATMSGTTTSMSGGPDGSTAAGGNSSASTAAALKTEKKLEFTLKAMDKTAQFLDVCSGQSFLCVARPNGILTMIRALCTPSLATSPACSPNTMKSLRDAGRCILLACMDRARRTGGLKCDQAPRVGWFGKLRPKDLLQLESQLRAAWAADMLPRQSPSLAKLPPAPAPPTPSVLESSQSVMSHTTAGSQEQVEETASAPGRVHAGTAVTMTQTSACPEKRVSETVSSSGLTRQEQGNSAMTGTMNDSVKQLQALDVSSTGDSPRSCVSSAPCDYLGSDASCRSEYMTGHGHLHDSHSDVSPPTSGTATAEHDVISVTETDIRRHVGGSSGSHDGQHGNADMSDHDDNHGDGYDSDGIRVRYTSGPTPLQHRQRQKWLDTSLADKITWSQKSDTVDMWMVLPPNTTKRDVRVDITASRLTVSLSWAGRVLDGPLARRVKASEAIWVIETDGQPGRQQTPANGNADQSKSSLSSTWPRSGNAAATSAQRRAAHACGDKQQLSTRRSTGSARGDVQKLHVALPKDELRYWRSLFEGGPEKSHIEVLKEAVEADEPVQSWDELSPEAREIVEDLRERQWMVSNGHLDMENSFDDFRLVVGDNTL